MQFLFYATIQLWLERSIYIFDICQMTQTKNLIIIAFLLLTDPSPLINQISLDPFSQDANWSMGPTYTPDKEMLILL